MDINEQLTCKYCKEIYKEPLSLSCCGENICKCHIEELLSIDETNHFFCPFCGVENLNLNLCVNKLIQNLLNNQLHKFELDSNYKETLNKFKIEIEKLESILKEPENFIYEEIHELKRQIDLDRERSKVQIDELADGFIKKLEEHEKKFKSEYKSNVNLLSYHALVETSKMNLFEYEKCLNLFSVKREERDEKTNQSEKEISSLKLKIKELKKKLSSNLSISYRPIENQKEDFFGKLIIKEKDEFWGEIQNEFKYIHDGPILALAILPNGDLVSAGEDETIIIWNTNDGTINKSLTGHISWIRDLVVLDENCLISASYDKTIRIWNLNDGTVERTLIGHISTVSALKMLQNGDLASASADKTIKIWDIHNGALKKTLEGHTGTVWSLELLNNGDLASASSDSTIIIWDVDTGAVKRTLIEHADSVYVLTLLESGDLVSGSADKTIKIWNIEDGTVKRTLTGHTKYVFALKIIGNGDLVSGSKDGTIKIWDVGTGLVKKEMNVDSRINSFVILENEDLVSASDESIIVWD